jgi:hypothetical protein
MDSAYSFDGSMAARASAGPSALVVAHPGHELRVHGWLEQARPLVFVLTDGSGSSGRPRLASTRAVLEGAGATPGALFGRFGDAALYAALLDLDFSFFLRVADELADAFAAAGIACVVGDACEGYNPGHDACRLVIDAAVALAGRRRGRPPLNFDFPLVGRPDECPPALRDRSVRVRLDDAAFARKLRAARSYAEMAGEVGAALRRHGERAFRVECLRPAGGAGAPGRAGPTPFYEYYGEKMLSLGRCARVVRRREHLVPLAAALRRAVAGRAA